MKAERLQIANTPFLINRLIYQAPKSTLIREFVKNADENAALIPLEKRRIDIYPVEIDGVRKLAFFNMDLSRFSAAPSSHLSGLSFESQGAFPT